MSKKAHKLRGDRPVTVGVRILPVQWEALQRAASARGISASALLREVLATWRGAQQAEENARIDGVLAAAEVARSKS
jgi:hypothetical protein